MGKYIKEDGADITTPMGRLSWTFIFSEDPKQKKGDLQKYKTTIMLPKNAKALESLGLNAKQTAKVLQDVQAFVDELTPYCENLAKGEFKAKYKKTRWNPILDGDTLTETWEGNANFWLIRTKSKFEPTVIDRKNGPISSDDCPQGLYSGCWARIKVSPYTYSGENTGVACGLGFYIQKIANDEEFKGVGKSVDDAFDSDIDDLDISDSDFDNTDLDADDDLI